MPVLDSSFLVALFNDDDEHHPSALAMSREPGPFVIPGPILSEFLSVVSYRVRKESGAVAAHREARATYQSIRAEPAFLIEPEFDLASAENVYLQHAHLSYVDAVAIAVALTTGDDLFTFDGEQAAAARAQRR